MLEIQLNIWPYWYDFLLFQLVADDGGFDIVCQERRWTKIALQMGFAPGKAVGSHLRGHYERILYPYNLFLSGANLLVSYMHVWTRQHVLSPMNVAHLQLDSR